ncbi:hypothetical protein PV325_009356 [Microctonus aethiopoides]|uniref:C2H2-type domain-containing protein n=1 Tax=Microctonus aethiopoides TaxID=144406 RepID=A0AA39KLU3_9HYME|nr:hypothetical protein PV325_009356 [Microctonus aethiopoides]KAK0166076.1 hypothetical protein PV328_004525 [Microctonus aethiopoides]
MLRGKMIENPEVPGLEETFPPPPPIILKKEPEIEENLLPIVAIPSVSMPAPPGIIDPFYISPPAQPLPWWVPTDADTKEPYSQWLDPQQKTNFVVAPTEKTKVKSAKRKIESIDPVQDAERVASAQRELTGLMKPLKCDLCNAVMNSTLQAKLHYDGKPHQKKVSMFLNQSVKKLKTEEKQQTNITANDWSTYCDVCKTWFTSQTDAAQHYAGKKHIRATTGAPKPKSPKKNPNEGPVDPTGRFGIGLSFVSDNEAITNSDQVSGSLSSIPSSPVLTGYASNATNYSTALRCDLCGVSANRLEQLETHRRGARHQKMLRLNGVTNTTSITPKIECTTAAAAVTIDYSICRTPSGLYYCAPCNKSFNSENSFAQHVESKKHKNQVNPKSPINQSSSNAKKKGKTKK